MSVLNVIVLALNGRKQKVKCTPNTTILQILEEVCKKHELNPEEYDVKHHNKVLDTTTTFRFSGLPNNAQLELVPALKNRNESSVILAINFEDGHRITDTFSPNDTFLNVLKKCCPDIAVPERSPVVIYTRREIFGNELKSSTLRSAGITGGRAMIRVLNKNPELLHQQANISAALPLKPTEEKPYIRKFQPLYVNSVRENKESTQQMETDYLIKEKTDNPDLNETFKTTVDKRKSSLVDEPEKRKMLNTKQNVEEMDIDNTPIEEKIAEDEFVFCDSRNGMIFSLESAQSVRADDLPDDFFELTIDDAKMIFRDLKKKRHALENQMMKTSRLRDLEEQEKQDRKLKKYKRAVIRVQFSDRTVIQGIFQPQETIQDVLNFIRCYLKDQNLDFYIYSTPPKSILNNQSKLIDIGCVPGALVHFGTNQEQKDGFLKDEYRKMFTTNVIAGLAAARIRQQNTNKINEDTENENIPDMEIGNSGNVTDEVNYGASTSRNITGCNSRKISSSENTPKWFQPL